MPASKTKAAASAANGHAPEVTGIEVLRLVTTPVPENPPERPRTEVFSIDGTSHTMLADPTVNEALSYLEVIQRRGPDAGLSFMMNLMLGTESHAALLGYRELTNEQYAQVAKVVRDRLLGSLEGPKETSSPEQGKSSGS